MPLGLIVSLIVLGVIILTGVAGYLIDKSDPSPDRASDRAETRREEIRR